MRIVTLDRDAGTASGVYAGINGMATVQSRADSGLQVEFGTRGNTASDPHADRPHHPPLQHPHGSLTRH